jgi:ABC-type transporter Mla subunit MlaD
MTPTTKKDQAQQHADKARESAGQAVDKAKEGAHNAVDAARDSLGQAGEKARDAASHAGQAISSAASAATQAVQNAASSAAHAVGHKAEQATSALGSGMQSLADTVRDRGPESGMLGSASHYVADTLDSTGRYIEDRNLGGMMDDLTGVIRRNPIPAVLVGMGIGFLLGRVLRS